MSRTRHILVAGGLCLAGALVLPGCAANRSVRPATDWKRVFFPFRTARTTDNVEQPAESLEFEAPLQQAAPSASVADEYYNPRSADPVQSRESAKPPVAPPAEEPGFLSEDEPSRATTGVKSDSSRPARLRDVFENLGRRPVPRPAPAIPLDEPVADVSRRTATHMVGYEQTEIVTLGRPDFSDAAESEELQ